MYQKNKCVVNKDSGITLIALIVMIIILTILAGISIVTLIGDNGLVRKASNASIQAVHVQVKEAMIAENAEYAKKQNMTLVEYLQSEGIIEENPEQEDKYIITVKKLLNQDTSVGNGSYSGGQYKDLYVFEAYEDENEEGNAVTYYKVMYYEKDNDNSMEILDLGKNNQKFPVTTANNTNDRNIGITIQAIEIERMD